MATTCNQPRSAVETQLGAFACGTSNSASRDLVSIVLDGTHQAAAYPYAIARLLALQLRTERHEDALLPWSISESLRASANDAHCDAEIAACVAAGKAGAAWQ